METVPTGGRRTGNGDCRRAGNGRDGECQGRWEPAGWSVQSSKKGLDQIVKNVVAWLKCKKRVHHFC